MSETPQIETVFDDSEQHIGRVYAQALLSAGAKQSRSDQIVDELSAIVEQVFASSPKLEAMLVNPRVEPSEKLGVIERIFGGKIDDTLLKFLKVCATRRRLNSLRSITKAAREMQDAAAGRLQVQVTTAQALDTKQLDQLHAKLKQVLSADVRMTTKVDPEILGGLIVRVGDTLYDASVDGRLKQMKRTAQQQAEATIRQRVSELAS
jgi:F-type H+-transporting ATPase subunit delta